MSNFEYISILVRRYFFYIGYLFVVVFFHLSSVMFDDLHLILFHHYLGYILLASIGYTHLNPKVNISNNVFRWFYLVNIIYYLLMAWTSISPELDQFNQWMVLILAVILLYTGIEKMQKVLIENMPNSEHDKKLRKFDKFIGKVQYFEHIMSREDLTDSQKVQFIKKELGNLK